MILPKPNLRPSTAIAGMTLFVSLSVGMSAPSVRGSEKPAGEQVFRSRCAACHGAKGEGTKQFPKPPPRKAPGPGPAAFIGQTMPPGPKKVSPPDAPKGPPHHHDPLYPPIAQARNKPARIEL